MSDIHQEWRDLRAKNGEFISHLDGEMAKLEKEKKLLDEQKQQIFYDPMTCTYFKADPEEIQKKFESMRKDLMYRSECLAKMSADYSALIEEKADLQKQLDAAKKELNDFIVMYDKAHAEAHQAKVAKDRMRYSNRCMQSKIAKQSNEIKRLTHENVGLVIDIRRHKNEIEKLKQGNWDEMERLQNANAKLEYDNFQLKQALGTSAKDADANFERGHHKGQEELWGVLQDVSEAASMGFDLEPVYGYNNMSDVVANLTASAFLKKTEEDEKKAKDIQIGDEVKIVDKFDPDLDDTGIVIMIYEPKTDCEPRIYTVIGPQFEAQIDATDIESGSVRKTGKHFDSIPLDYFA